jgi:hypothetical protein
MKDVLSALMVAAVGAVCGCGLGTVLLKVIA